MSPRVVVNSTPLIALAKMSKLSILAELFGRLLSRKRYIQRSQGIARVVKGA